MFPFLRLVASFVTTKKAQMFVVTGAGRVGSYACRIKKVSVNWRFLISSVVRCVHSRVVRASWKSICLRGSCACDFSDPRDLLFGGRRSGSLACLKGSDLLFSRKQMLAHVQYIYVRNRGTSSSLPIFLFFLLFNVLLQV